MLPAISRFFSLPVVVAVFAFVFVFVFAFALFMFCLFAIYESVATLTVNVALAKMFYGL